MNLFLQVCSKANKMIEVLAMEVKEGDYVFGLRRGFLSPSLGFLSQKIIDLQKPLNLAQIIKGFSLIELEENVKVEIIEETALDEKGSENFLTPIKEGNDSDKSFEQDIPLESLKLISSSFDSDVVALGASSEPTIPTHVLSPAAILDEALVGCSTQDNNPMVVYFDVPDSLLADLISWLGSSLVGGFYGNQPNIDTVRKWIH